MAKEQTKIEPSPLPESHSETVTAVVHYYRAELARMAGWRDRIDRTTNWAITVVAALLSVSLSSSTAHHGVLLFAMLLIYLLLMIEARRYRFFDVYRFRVRQLERHYFAQIFSPIPDYSANWPYILGQNLREPKFFISYGDAFSRRLRRNYIWIFLVLAISWVVKITIHPNTPRSFAELIDRMRIGPIPPWFVLLTGVIFNTFLFILAVTTSSRWSGGETTTRQETRERLTTGEPQG